MVINDLYRFWLDLPGKGITQVYPFNSQMEWVDKKKSGYRFYQRTLKNSLILKDAPKDNNYGFTYLMDMERQGMTCEQVDVIIDKWCDCNETWTEGFYNGYLRLNAGEWDVSTCTVTIPVIVNDIYACLTSSWENEVNMFDYGDEPVQISPFIGVIQKVTCTSDAIYQAWNPAISIPAASQQMVTYFWSHFQTDCLEDIVPGSQNAPWTLIKHTFITKFYFLPDPFNPGQTNLNILHAITLIRSEWAREFVAGPTQPPGTGWYAATGGWARGVNVVLGPVYDHTTTEGVAALEEEWAGVDSGSDFPFNIGILSKWIIVGEDANGNSTFTNGKELGPVLEDLLSPCGLTVVSNFYNINPDGSAPDNEFYTNAETDFHGIILYQISDIARIDETQSATIAIIRLKKLLDALKIIGNADVDIDGTTLRIEHLSYWPEVVQMDLTLPEFYYLIEQKWKYTYDEESQPKYEIVAWDSETDGKGNDFDGYPIEYDNVCVNNQDDKIDKTYIAEGFLSNILKIIGNEEYFDDTERIVMVSTTDLVINSAVQPISGLEKLNGNLAMGYLIPRYYTYGRPFKEGSINKVLTPFYSLIRNRLQAPITIPFQCDDYLNNYNPSHMIKTQLGACQIHEASYTDPDQTLEVKLRGK
jgi:hypothetical protein